MKRWIAVLVLLAVGALAQTARPAHADICMACSDHEVAVHGVGNIGMNLH